jgi:hypothetical protein
MLDGFCLRSVRELTSRLFSVVNEFVVFSLYLMYFSQ